VQYGLVKVSYVTRKAYQFQFLFTRYQVEDANKIVHTKILEWKMVQQVLQSIFSQNGVSS